MKEFKIVPKSCTEYESEETKDVIKAIFKGSVTVKVPNYSERQEFRSISIGMVLENDEKEQAILSLPSMSKLVEKSRAFYTAVEIECIEDGTKFSSFEDMEYDPRCETILNEVAITLSRGITPSKN